ncbi:MAG: hypothetical protein Q9226_004049 [Calogaya cf. arnoldii]
MVKLYNEIVKRQEHTVGLEPPLQAYHGDMILKFGPEFASRFRNLDIKRPNIDDTNAIMALAAENHGTLSSPLSAIALTEHFPACNRLLRRLQVDECFQGAQIVTNLQQLIRRLKSGGTLLIIDIGRDGSNTRAEVDGLVNGRKTTGYAARALSINYIDESMTKMTENLR